MWVESLGPGRPLEGGTGNPLSIPCLAKFHGQSLASYKSMEPKELDTTD